ncbi:MAG: hypothetical protein SOZ34_06525 [Clostridia bacterium]|nr:hypothetical protein [Clostridia bacterium]
MPERYKNVEFGSLSDYITPDKFRTISESMRSIPMGVTEFAVEIHLKKNVKNKLSFKTPWDGIIYGCAREKDDLKQKLNLESEIKVAYIMDWDDKFLVLLELKNSSERPVVYVHSEDVIYLLENCWRIPEQR